MTRHVIVLAFQNVCVGRTRHFLNSSKRVKGGLNINNNPFWWQRPLGKFIFVLSCCCIRRDEEKRTHNINVVGKKRQNGINQDKEKLSNHSRMASPGSAQHYGLVEQFQNGLVTLPTTGFLFCNASVCNPRYRALALRVTTTTTTRMRSRRRIRIILLFPRESRRIQRRRSLG